jgi:NitT/TauT family transport system substrate-binding protein
MNSPAKSIADLAGKRIATGPGIQNVTLTKIILEKNGYPNAKVTELPVGQHLAALAAGQVDGVYALEPTGTIGRLKGMARTLETGVISKYVLGNAEAPWFGGAATLTTAFLKERPAEARKYVAAYAKAVELILAKPAEVRQHLDGFTGIEEALVKEVPLPGFVMHNQFKPSDLDYFQKYFDVLAERKIFSAPLAVKPLIYQG